jgi:translation initiation factor 4A
MSEKEDTNNFFEVSEENISLQNNDKDKCDIPIYKTFEEMNLKQNILRGIFSHGFETPSYIQQKAIVQIQSKKDLIGQSQSGTGKTGAFTIGILNLLLENKKGVQALILSPTRELSEQIYNVFLSISKYTKLKISLSVGGTITEKLDDTNVIIGTPGRVLDLLKNQRFNLQNCSVFTLDEADEMLSKGFKEQIYEIFQYVPNDIQVLLFSATMPQEIFDITKKFMRNPLNILVKNEELTLEGIRQYYVYVEEENWKFDTLADLYKMFEITQGVIFCNSKQKVENLTQRLLEQKFMVSGIHSDVTNRQAIMNDFKYGKTRILITTDLLARGIDVQHISLVINYDIPRSKEIYIHRIGRSGRFGRKGIAINFVSKQEAPMLKEIEKYYSTEINELPSDIKIN